MTLSSKGFSIDSVAKDCLPNGLSSVNNSEEAKIARAALRERFLKFLSSEIGSTCELLTVEGNIVKGKFEGSNYNHTQVLISNLQTPMAALPLAQVRLEDIAQIDFSESSFCKKK